MAEYKTKAFWESILNAFHLPYLGDRLPSYLCSVDLFRDWVEKYDEAFIAFVLEKAHSFTNQDQYKRFVVNSQFGRHRTNALFTDTAHDHYQVVDKIRTQRLAFLRWIIADFEKEVHDE